MDVGRDPRDSTFLNFKVLVVSLKTTFTYILYILYASWGTACYLMSDTYIHIYYSPWGIAPRHVACTHIYVAHVLLTPGLLPQGMLPVRMYMLHSKWSSCFPSQCGWLMCLPVCCFPLPWTAILQEKKHSLLPFPCEQGAWTLSLLTAATD